jgi:hypothetical protein
LIKLDGVRRTMLAGHPRDQAIVRDGKRRGWPLLQVMKFNGQ